MKKYFLISVFILTAIISFAQKSLYDTIDPMVLINTGAFKPSIVESNKINTNPVVIDSTKKIAVKSYSISTKKINTGFDVEPIPAAQMVNEPLTKLYNGLVKLGFGNYTTPYGEVWYNSLRSKEYAYGIRMKHYSSSYTAKDFGKASFSDNEISLYGKKFLKEHTLLGNFDYARNVVHFYGYSPPDNFQFNESDATIQRFNYFTGNAELMSHYTSAKRMNHDVKISYYNLTDSYKASENNINANGYVQTAVAKELLKVNASVDFYNYKTSTDTTNNTIITLNPNFIAKGEKYSAKIGLTAVMDNFVQSKFYFYPVLDLSYNIVENIIIPYAGASGGLQKNSFKGLTDENPFMLSAITMKNTNNQYRLYGGLKGTLSSNIAYNARASYTNIKDMPLFVNTTDLLANRFDVIYDDATELNVRGEVSYQSREKLRISLSGDYYNYKMKTEQRAWYKPQVKVNASANYNLDTKIIVKVDLFYIDNQFYKTTVDDAAAPDGERVVPVELKGVFDANIGGEYRYTKNLGFFLNFNNIANQRYFRYSNYPSQKFFVMGGLSYSF